MIRGLGLRDPGSNPGSPIHKSKIKMIVKRLYRDEELRYKTLARDMTPLEAKRILEENQIDGLIERMNENRLSALRTRAEEEYILKLNISKARGF